MDPKLTKDTESEFSVAVVKSFTHPLPMERPKEIFPDGSKASAKPARYKPLPFDRERVFSQDPTLCLHWLNLPLNDGLLFVSQAYQQIKAMVDTYQLEHVDAFYEQYSDLLEAVLSDSEKSDRSGLTTNYLRMNHKIFDRRLAHLLWHYYNAMYMYEGSLANLCILANVNGPGKFKDFGVACKVSYINTRSNRYGAYPKPVGSENYVTNYSKFAAGHTFNGAVFISIPQWITDIYGNRGQHSFNLSDVAAGFAPTGDQINVLDQNSNDYLTLAHLYNNMYDTIHYFGADVTRGTKHINRISNILDPKNKATAIPSTPYIENGATLSFKTALDQGEGNSFACSFKLNYSGSADEDSFSNVKDGEGNDVSKDNIISRAWDTFLFWQTYAEEYFSAFAMPTSQIHELFMKLGYLEKSKTNVQFFGEVNVNEVFDALDIRRDMIYKKDNKVNTATIVKWMPIMDKENEGTGTAYGSDFERNFNRYPVDLDDAFEIIKKAEEYPSLTPTIFHEVSDDTSGKLAPYVANATLSASSLSDGSEQTFPAAGVLGRFASLFDLACCANVDPSADWVDTIAIDPEVAKMFIQKNDGIILKSRPTSPRVFTQPLIDSSDLYQCGFNVIIASNSVTSNEFERWFKDGDNYFKGNNIDLPGSVVINSKTGDDYNSLVPNCGVVEVSGTHYLTENRVLNDSYLNLIKHAVIFVGDAIFIGPQLAACKLAAGTYAERIYQQNGGTFISNLIGAFTNLPADPTSDLPGDETVTEAIIKSTAIAACFNDPKLGLPSVASEYVAMKAAFPQLVPPPSDMSGLEVREYVFDPSYGIVLPTVYDTPDCGLLPTMGYEGNHKATDGREDAVAFGPKQYVANVHAGGQITSALITAGRDYDLDQIMCHMDYDSRSCCSQFLLWFVDRIQFKRLYTIGRQIYSYEDVVKLPGFSSPAKTFLALLQRGIVFWNGVEDTLFLYNIPDERKHQRNADWGSIGKIDFGGMIRTPVVKNTTFRGKRLSLNNPAKSDSLTTEQAEALKGNPQSTTDSRRDRKRPNGKRHNKRRQRENRKDEMSEKKRDNEFDPSDKAIDDKVAKEDKSFASKLMNEANSVLQN